MPRPKRKKPAQLQRKAEGEIGISSGAENLGFKLFLRKILSGRKVHLPGKPGFFLTEVQIHGLANEHLYRTPTGQLVEVDMGFGLFKLPSVAANQPRPIYFIPELGIRVFAQDREMVFGEIFKGHFVKIKVFPLLPKDLL